MNSRKISDGDIQTVVRSVNYPTQVDLLIKMTEKWSSEDFLYAFDRLNTDQPADRREALRTLYLELREKREADEARAVMEAAGIQRHEEISRKLEELKRPHWSIVPNFWMTLGILILTLILVVLALVTR
jgi:hypothetical protein